MGCPEKMLCMGSNPLVDDGHTPITIVTLFLVAGRVPYQTFYHSLELLLL